MLKNIIRISLASLLAATLANASANVENVTVKTLVEKGETLDKKVVQAKGTVVKVSKAIMQTDWVHVEDETGAKIIFRAPSTNVNVGDKVTATGTVNANVDYGYGYTYKVIVVDSNFKKM